MGFFDLDRWNEIWQTIQRNKKRSIMTAMGVFWGVFMLVVLLGVGLGLSGLLHSVLGGLSPNSAFLFTDATSLPYQGMAVGRGWSMNNDDVESIKKIDGIKYAAPLFWGRNANAVHGTYNGEYGIVGYTPDYQLIDPVAILKGRFINDLDMQTGRKVCVIGDRVESELFPNKNPIGETILVNSGYYMVVGVVKRTNSVQMGADTKSSIIMPATLFQQIYNLGESINSIAITAYDDQDMAGIKQECKLSIKAAHLISPLDEKAVSDFDLSEMFAKFANLFLGIVSLTWIVGLGTLFAGIVGVSNIMLVMVKERTQEIGIRRALGAKPRVIIEQILSEAFVLTFVAGIVGLAAAVGLISVIEELLAGSIQGGNNTTIPTSFQISFGLGMLCMGIIVVGSLIAGIIPAMRALQIKAVDALRDE